jgi:hypothetical protein
LGSGDLRVIIEHLDGFYLEKLSISNTALLFLTGGSGVFDWWNVGMLICGIC